MTTGLSSPKQRARKRSALQLEDGQHMHLEVVEVVSITAQEVRTTVEEHRNGVGKLAVSYLVINHGEKELPSNGF